MGCRQVGVRVGVAVTVIVASGCGSSRSSHSSASFTTTPPPPNGLTGCIPTPPLSLSQKGISELLVLFNPGTTAAEMDAVANDLLPLSRAGVETATALGIVSVGGATCDPPEIPIGYRSSLKSSQLAELEQRLLAEPRVAKVTLEPATPGAPTPPNLIPLSSDGLYLRPVLCTIPPTTSGAKVDTGPAVDACSSQHPALIASTTPAGDSAAAQVIVPNFDNSQRYVLGPADLTVKGVASAIAAQDPATGGFQVELSLTNQANQVMNRVAAVRYSYYKQSPPNPPHQSEEAIEVGGVVQSAPPVQSPSFNGTLIISYTSYTMTQADAKRIVQVIDTASKD